MRYFNGRLDERGDGSDLVCSIRAEIDVGVDEVLEELGRMSRAKLNRLQIDKFLVAIFHHVNCLAF